MPSSIPVPIHFILLAVTTIFALIAMIWKMRGGYLSSIAANVTRLTDTLTQYKEEHAAEHVTLSEKVTSLEGKVRTAEKLCNERHKVR